eukprot:2605238-Alexandrium_andersonii.AAC.1
MQQPSQLVVVARHVDLKVAAGRRRSRAEHNGHSDGGRDRLLGLLFVLVQLLLPAENLVLE